MLGLRQRRSPEPVAAASGGSIAADISGSVSNSQIAVGEKMVQHNYGPGSTVNTIVAGEARAPRERQKPVSQLPRDAPRLHGRTAEIDRARGAMDSGQPIQFSGPSGLGKTALLRHLSHRPGGRFPDGVVYYRSRRESLDDLLMRIFEFLYDSDAATRVKPTTAELARYLGAVEALFLLDDVDLDREDLETLLLTVPRSVFVFGSPERSLWHEGESVALRGLPQDAALALVEEGLGRRLSETESAELAQLCGALDGHPLQLIKAVAQIREEGATLAQLLSQASGGAGATAPAPADRLTAQLAADLPDGERCVLSLLAALDGAALHVDHVAALTSQADAAAILAELEERRLAQSHSPRYSATAPIAALQDPDASHRWCSSLLSYFIDHAERHRAQPERLRDDLEPIIQTLRWGMTCAPHADVLRLAQATGVVAESAGLWDAWRSILDIALQAARTIGDRGGEGWALHQLGTRALCLEQEDEAARQLGAALRIREKIGDEAGAAVTRHNLGHLPGFPPPSSPSSAPPGGPPWLAALCVAAAVAVLSAAAVPGLSSDGSQGAGERQTAPSLSPWTPVQPARDPADAPRPASGDPIPEIASVPPGDPDPPPEPPDEPKERELDTSGPDPPPEPPDEPQERELETSGDPEPAPVPDPAPKPEPEPDPAPAPAPTPSSCKSDLLTTITNLVRRELGVVERLLRPDSPRAVVAAQVDAVARLLEELGHHCSRAETEQQLRRLGAAAD